MPPVRLAPTALSPAALAPTALACVLLAGGAQAACLANATDRALFFTIDAKAAEGRVARTLGPGGTLCLPETSGAVFRVFASPDEVEGCSRLVAPGGSDTLTDFHPYDNCRWASHGD
ncbi:hypothetical protein [Albidovulum sp.]